MACQVEYKHVGEGCWQAACKVHGEIRHVKGSKAVAQTAGFVHVMEQNRSVIKEK